MRDRQGVSVTPKTRIEMGKRHIGLHDPTYFIADVAANHDGDLGRAIELIHMCAEAGANAAKFQHFKAETIVSDHGFKNLGGQVSHQAKWNKSVFEVYQDASLNHGWTPKLKEACDKAGIDFFTSPYDLPIVDEVDPFVSAYKVGSGDITWLEIIRKMATKAKPVLLATGASSMEDVARAVDAILPLNQQLVLMQCNTNYTASLENFRHIQLNVLQCFRHMYPDLVLGLSDHTPGCATVLGAVTLGARAIEKHFTDSNARSGPDHVFSMNPQSWKEMVDRTRELELALGTGVKCVEENEAQTVVLQRRAIRASKKLSRGAVLEAADLVVLRPCPAGALPPYEIDKLIGRALSADVEKGEVVAWNVVK
jgi:sialic acid synthase SpsE